MHILIVEDNQHDYQIAKRILEKSDLACQVAWAQRGEQALERLQDGALDGLEPFDVILIDYNLPGITGLETFEQIVAQGLDVPVVFLTGAGDVSIAVEALKLGAQDYLVKDPPGEYLGLLPMVVRKARVQWEIEQARLRAEETLRESEERYRELVESSLQGIVVRQGRKYILVNQSFADMVGYSRHELLGFTPDEIYALVHPADREMIAQRYRDRQAGKLMPDSYEHRFICRNGETRWTQVTVTRIKVRGTQAFLGMYLDVTERKRANEALRQYAVELEARNEELDAFAHTAAHDLKGPLARMVGFAEALEQGYAELADKELRRYLLTIAQGGRKMSNIVDELLLLASVRQKKVVTLCFLDMTSIVDEARARLADLIEERLAEIIVPEEWPVALGHGPWVEEVWVNYLSNALKYGGEPPRVELGFDDSGQWTVVGGQNTPTTNHQPQTTNHQPPTTETRFWVRDNGPGLTPEEQGRLFKPFERLDQVRVKGHGLGLSIARRIVEKLGGQVGVESVLGQGSTFYFTLPSACDDQ